MAEKDKREGDKERSEPPKTEHEHRPVEDATRDIPEQLMKPASAEAAQPDQIPIPGPREPARWGRPLARLDRGWTKFETWLCATVLVLEVLALSLWVGLKGLSSPSDSGSSAGIVFRAISGGVLLGLIGYFATKKQSMLVRRIAGSAGLVIGFALARAWQNFGVDWSSNLLNWYQQASSLTLLGGLRGVATRLTLLLAVLGGSLATAAGKHITIDLITRFLKPKARLPVVVIGWVGASVISGVAAWGFFEHISIENFEAKADATAGQKVRHVGHGLSENWFILRKQVALDFKSLPHVVKGERYANWLNGAEWNQWLTEVGFVERYGPQAVEAVKIPDDAKRSPIVVVPGKGEPRGELIHAANLVVPIGLLIIAIRFILLCLLSISGHMVIDPEAQVEGELARKHDEDILDEEKT